MANKYFLPNIAPLHTTIRLGSLIPNISQPDQDAFTGLTLEPGTDYFIHPQANLGKLIKTTTNKSFALQVIQLLTSSFSKSNSDSQWLEECEVRHYQLRQPKALFKKTCESDEAKEWLQNEVEYGSRAVYFTVGYYTAVDATVGRSSSYTSQTSLGVQVPIADIASMGATLPLGGFADLNVGGEVGYGRANILMDKARMEGERIYAICYRKVRFSFWPWKDKLESRKLEEGNFWRMTSDNRGDDDGENDEALEVVMEDLDEEDEDNVKGFEV
ncbi:uncharacterized protein LY89DRAFT_685884 [Mollisia scopiformis]|uniref:Uncharacterized protein n=1 Tax=Mollisia scopiformis TaxID=149040 RepID=A0A194X779_MOLSC|nr:uncharacterized protein LY89DRAFT_685884 [Mollisia scopiformis]KUJ16026.1 hypothetical protein LY89DRAFT_685884 [Mollisia scopiformis]